MGVRGGEARIHIEALVCFALAVVFNARGGYSNYNFGIAFGIGRFESNQYLGESPM